MCNRYKIKLPKYIFKPVTYIQEKWMVKYSYIEKILLIMLAGLSPAFSNMIDRVSESIITQTIQTEDHIWNQWHIFWAFILVEALINGILVRYIGGWWFNIRLKLAGEDSIDIEKGRNIAMYLSGFRSIPIFLLFIVTTIVFPNIYIAYTKPLIKVLYYSIYNMLGFLIIYCMNEVVKLKYYTDYKKRKIWFIYIPVSINVLTILLLFY